MLCYSRCVRHLCFGPMDQSQLSFKWAMAMVGENTVLKTQHFGDWCSHARGSEFIFSSTLSH